MEFKLSSVLRLSLLYCWVGSCSLSNALPENAKQFLISCTWWFGVGWCKGLIAVGTLPPWKFMSVSDTKGCDISFRPSTGIGDTNMSLLLDETTTGLVCSTLLLLLFLDCLGVFGGVSTDVESVLFLRSKGGCPLGMLSFGQANWKLVTLGEVDWGGRVVAGIDDDLPWLEWAVLIVNSKLFVEGVWKLLCCKWSSTKSNKKN